MSRGVLQSRQPVRCRREAGSMSELARRCVLTLFAAMLLAASPAMAENRSDHPQVPGPDYGVALTPAVYFVNFLFMYFTNSRNAAIMPAYPGQTHEISTIRVR